MAKQQIISKTIGKGEGVGKRSAAYCLFGRETLDLGREYPEGPLDAPAYTHLRGPNQWPEQLPHFKPAILQLLESMQHVGLRVLRAMAQSLGINEAEFMDMFGEDLGMRMKLVYYPGMENKTNVPLDHGIGVGPHKVRVGAVGKTFVGTHHESGVTGLWVLSFTFTR